MRVLIIGGAGLLGMSLAPLLEAEGHEVAICDNFTGSIRYRTPDNYRIFTASATDVNSMQHVMAVFNPEIIFVSLAYICPKDVVYTFYEDTRVALSSANVLASVLSRNVKRVYFCSSHEVYGSDRVRGALKETRKVSKCSNHLGSAKYAAESFLDFRCQELGIDYTILRIFHLYGPRITFSARTDIINFLIDAFLRREQLGLVAAKKQKDFIHVEDAAQAILGIFRAGAVGPINIGSGEGLSLRELVRMIGNHMTIYNYPDELPEGGLATGNSVADISLLKSIVPEWSPHHSVDSSIPNLIEFRKKELDFYSRSNPLAVLNAMRGISNG